MSESTTVQMLWESADPRHALEHRFGFGDPAAAGRWLAAALREHWDIRVEHCERILISDRNALAWLLTSSGQLVAKWSIARERFDRLAELAELTNWLDGRGIPVSAPIASRDGRHQLEFDGVSLGLQHEIDGDLLEVSEPGLVHAAGAALARLQDALADYPAATRIRADRPGQVRPLALRIETWLDRGAGQLPARTGVALRRLVAEMPPDPVPVQLAHRDFRAANVLCAGGEVAAILDFEQAGPDHPVLEVAHSAVLLGTRFRDWGPVSTEVRRQFLAGYQSVRTLTAVEAAWWPILVCWQSLDMVPDADDPTGWGTSALTALAEAETLSSARRK